MMKTLFRHVWRTYEDYTRGWQTIPSDHDSLKAFAEISLAHYREWFGGPADRGLLYVIRQRRGRERAICFYSKRSARYVLTIPSEAAQQEQRLFNIAQAMYFRVTMRRKGLHRQAWVDRMLLQLSATRVLRENGSERYILNRKNRQIKQTKEPIDVAALRKVVGVKEKGLTFFPEGFDLQVNCLARALAAVVGWENFCRLIEMKSLEEWFVVLPAAARPAVRHLLALPGATMPTFKEGRLQTKFGLALFHLGRREAGYEQVRMAIQREPDNAEFYFHLGVLLKMAGEYEAAIEPSLYLLSVEKWRHFAFLNLMRIHAGLGQWESALEWGRLGIAACPEKAVVRLLYGCVLNDAGYRREARAEWESVRVLHPNDLHQEVEEALREYPVDADLDKKAL